MQTNTAHPAVRLLQSFFAEMFDWETQSLKEDRAIDWDNATQEDISRVRKQRREKLVRIFEKYCDVGGGAKRLQDQGLAFGDPAEYHPKNELIVTVTENKGKVIVETKQNFGFRWKKLYELVQVEGQWKVRDNTKRSSENNPKWKSQRL